MSLRNKYRICIGRSTDGNYWKGDIYLDGEWVSSTSIFSFKFRAKQNARKLAKQDAYRRWVRAQPKECFDYLV